MRLNRIEIAGFKSFPDRAELTFDQGVTAIVGPNGCGKSNVVDALTWVLGEQSAKSLRGERMEDVIFGGSDARKPTAAAEVRLRLSGVAARVPGNGGVRPMPAGDPGGNAGPHALSAEGGLAVEEEPLIVRDVELMRRLYRSGESEYLIDGETCRLRDVQDLLMDAGLGVKAYAVIEQGKIGQILSARPTDRRQLIEEAAGVTKYKSRRRAAELKLEAAQQNLTRVDDIIFEVEKQRGTLKRQAAKARRYRRLREELRRWEKVQFTRRYRSLGEAIQSARTRLDDARAREAAAAAHVAEGEAALERLRLELTDADSRTTAAREAAHAAELEIGRLQQQIAFDRQQVEHLGTAASDIEAEVRALEARREPARLEIEARSEAALRAAADRDLAAEALAGEEAAYSDTQRNIEGLEADVEAARSELYAAVNAATALRHAMDHAAAAQARIGEQIAKLEVEHNDLRVEADRAAQERLAAEDSLQRTREAMAALRLERAARESELGAARTDRDARAQEFRTREHELARLGARLRSLEELDAARAEYGDGARLILAEAHGAVGHMGSVADYLEVDRRYERAVEACLGDLLQHVVVRTHDDAAAGLRLAADQSAGRVGFLVAAAEQADIADAGQISSSTDPADSTDVGRNFSSADPADSTDVGRNFSSADPADSTDVGQNFSSADPADSTDVGRNFSSADPADSTDVGRNFSSAIQRTPLTGVIRITGPADGAIRGALAEAWISESFESARRLAAELGSNATVCTVDGEVFRGPHRIEGGTRAEARGILATKREIKELRERVEEDRAAVERLREEIASLDVTIAAVESAIQGLHAELHRQEKAAVGFDLQVANAAESAERVARKQEQIATERRSAEEELRAQAARHDEARESIARIEVEQRAADEQLNTAQRRLFEAREAMQAQARRTAEAKAAHAALVERASALTAEVQRLEESARELEARLAARQEELRRNEVRRTELRESIVTSEATLDARLRSFDDLRERVREADEHSQALRGQFEAQDGRIRESRRALEAVRAEVAQLDVARATAESDLAHLASACMDAVQATLEEVAAEVEQLERDGLLSSPKPVDDAPDAAETGEDDAAGPQRETAAQPAVEASQAVRVMTPDEMVADLRAKIEKMGAVNMMAIDQFDDLESRHTFLTTQRKDLVDSIAATNEAIKKIDKTTKERFREAFTAINQNFEGTFQTLFGGGRAGLVLLDENDQLESGIDIIAQPPGKRLQSVQLLSGGEKALTAMALMFAIFQYRPSPFCLLDEIDAPLDDANIGRFVEMLQGMQEQTQFILITHNRKTMEIADRLYGVTMEEPGVSKLISVQLN